MAIDDFSSASEYVRDKVKQHMDLIRAGRTIPAEQVQAEMTEFKKKWKQNRNLKLNEGIRTVARGERRLQEIWVCIVNDNPIAASKLEDKIYGA